MPSCLTWWIFHFSGILGRLCTLLSNYVQLVQFSSQVMSNSLRPHELQHARASLSFTISLNLLKLMSVMPFNHLIFCCPLLLLPCLVPSIRVFSNESALRIWPKCWSFSFSFSISPSNEYLGLISFRIKLIWSPCYPRDSQESSPAPQSQSISSLVLSFLYHPTLTSVHDYWKSHSFDDMDLCWQNYVSTFKYTV